MPVTISIANQKGGVAKTTTALNLSAALALAGKQVLLADIDPQANATTSLLEDFESRVKNSYTVFLNPAVIRENIVSTSQRNLSLLPSAPALLNIERDIGHAHDRTERLFLACKHLDEMFDYIIVDCPPSLTLLSLNSLTASDYVIIPIQCEYFSMEGLSKILDVISEIRETKNLGLTLMGILFTMYDGHTDSAREVIDQVKAVFPEKVFTTIIPRDPSLSEAPSHATTIFGYDIASPGAVSYVTLAEEVLAYGENRPNVE